MSRKRRRSNNRAHFDMEAALRDLKQGSEGTVNEFATERQVKLLVIFGVEQGKAIAMTKHAAHRTIDRIRAQQAEEQRKNRKTPRKNVWQKVAEKAVK